MDSTPWRVPDPGTPERALLDALGAELGTDAAMLVALANGRIRGELCGQHPAGGTIGLGTYDEYVDLLLDFVNPGSNGYAARERKRREEDKALKAARRNGGQS